MQGRKIQKFHEISRMLFFSRCFIEDLSYTFTGRFSFFPFPVPPVDGVLNLSNFFDFDLLRVRFFLDTFLVELGWENVQHMQHIPTFQW